MATASQSLSQRFGVLRLGGWEPQAPAVGWAVFRWLSWSGGVGLSFATAAGGVLAAGPLLLLIASTLLGLITTVVLFSQAGRYRLTLVASLFDVMVAAALVRFTGAGDSSFLVYSFATVAGAGWLLGLRSGLAAGLVTAAVGVSPSVTLGSYSAYAVALVLFGGLASWIARYGAVLAERDTLERRLDAESQRLQLLQETVRRSASQVVGTLDPTRIYLAASAAARELLGVERAMILIADQSTGELRLVHDAGGTGDVTPRRFAVSLSGPSDWAGDGRRLCRLLSNHGLPATLAAPLRLENRLLGVLAVQGESRRVHTHVDQGALQTLASVTASALATARAHMECMAAYRRDGLRQTELAESLLNLQGTLASLHDEREICRRLAAGVVNALHVERAGVFLVSGPGDTAYLAGKRGIGWDDVAIRREFPLVDERPLAVRAIRSKKLVTAGPEAGELLLAEPEQRGSAIASPLLVGDEAVGAVFVESDNRQRLWRESEQRFLRILAHHAGLSLRKVEEHKLAERRAAQAQSLLQAAHVINSELELSSVLESIVQQAASLPGTQFSGLILTETEQPRLKAFVRSQGRKRELAVDLDDEFFATVIATHEARIATRSEDIPTVLNELGRLSAALALPMAVGRRVIGLLVLGRTAGARVVSDYDLRFLRYLADQAALALSRAQLYQQTRTQQRQNDALLQVGHLTASSLELRDVLRMIAASAASAVEVERASIYLFDGRQFLTPIAAIGFDAETEQAFGTIPLAVDAHPFTHDVVRQKRPAQADSRGLNAGRLAVWPLLYTDMRRVLGVPLIATEHVLGALFIHERRARRTFTAAEIDLLMGIGRQAAVAVENGELSEQARESVRHQRLLAVVERELTGSQSLEQRLTRILELVSDTLPIQSGSIALLDRHDLRLIAAYGQVDHHVRLPRAELPEGREMVDWITQEARPYVGSNGQLDATDGSAASYLAVPLISGLETLGVLQVESEQPGAFGEREMSLVTALGSQVASALARERMKAQIQELAAWKHRALEARDIHEAAGRMLAGAVIKLGATDLLAEVDREQALWELRQAKDLAADSLQQLRRGLNALGADAEVPRAALVEERAGSQLAEP